MAQARESPSTPALARRRARRPPGSRAPAAGRASGRDALLAAAREGRTCALGTMSRRRGRPRPNGDAPPVIPAAPQAEMHGQSARARRAFKRAVERKRSATARGVAACDARVRALAPTALPLLAELLPAEARLACAGMCRSWRAALAPAHYWLRLMLDTRSLSSAGATASAAACCAPRRRCLTNANAILARGTRTQRRTKRLAGPPISRC